MSTYRELAQRAHERVKANRQFAKNNPTQPRLDELYADHQRLADALETLLDEMHARELHHFEAELFEAKAHAQALRDAADFREEHDLDHDYWSGLASKLYQAGSNMVSVWLRYRADQIERGEKP